jgi:hypothetical protein
MATAAAGTAAETIANDTLAGALGARQRTQSSKELPEQGAAFAQAENTAARIALSKGHWFAIGVIACLALTVSVAWIAVVGGFVLRVLRWLFGT